MSEPDAPFWEAKSLNQMNRDEWESLCDGCALCCLYQLEDEDSGQLVFTDVCCNLLDTESCRCTRYSERKRLVKRCMVITPDNIEECVQFAPASCAYRLLHEGQALPNWHPLVSGDPNTVHAAGVSVRGRVVSEDDVDERDWEDHAVQWPDEVRY